MRCFINWNYIFSHLFEEIKILSNGNMSISHKNFNKCRTFVKNNQKKKPNKDVDWRSSPLVHHDRHNFAGARQSNKHQWENNRIETQSTNYINYCLRMNNRLEKFHDQSTDVSKICKYIYLSNSKSKRSHITCTLWLLE